MKQPKPDTPYASNVKGVRHKYSDTSLPDTNSYFNTVNVVKKGLLNILHLAVKHMVNTDISVLNSRKIRQVASHVSIPDFQVHL